MVDETLLFHGYDAAIIGTTNSWTAVTKVIYDGEKLVEMLLECGMTDDEAMEYIAYNMDGAYMGEGTPIIMWPYEEDEFDALG